MSTRLNRRALVQLGARRLGPAARALDLTDLRLLSLTDTAVTGDVASLSGLANLEILNLYSTVVTGEIASLSGLANLEQLVLRNTAATGSIDALSGLTNLWNLYLDSTAVTGNIASLSGLANLQFLYIQDTDIYGDTTAVTVSVDFQFTACDGATVCVGNGTTEARIAVPSTFAGRGPAQCCACPNGQRESNADRSLATCEPCEAGFGAPTPPLSTVCAQCAAGKEAPGAGMVCADCADGFMSEPDDTISCAKCPYGNRCVGGSCVVGSTGRGCASCDTNCTASNCTAARYFQVGQNCFPCPEGIATSVIVAGAVVAVVFLTALWQVTMVKPRSEDDSDGREDTEGTKENVETARSALQSASRISDTAIFTSITLPHLQFISFSFTLPFGWPDFVEEFASYVSSLVSIDFGQITSPECADMTDDSDTLFVSKFLITHGAFFAVNAILLIPKLTGHHRALHSTNAMIAVWTLTLSPLVKSCIRTIDCTHQPQYSPPIWSLDSMPSIECWADNTTFWVMAVMGCVLLSIYAVIIPVYLFRRLLHESRDATDERWDDEFLESHGWLLLRYKPNRWFFEFFLIAFKLTIVVASEMLDADENALTLLYVLFGGTLAFLLLVLVDKPYRDSQGHAGMTQADVLQSLQLAGQLCNYGLGYWCLTTQVARKAAGEPEVRPGTHLTDGEELGVAFLAFFFVVGPLAPLAVEVRKRHSQTGCERYADSRRVLCRLGRTAGRTRARRSRWRSRTTR